MTDLTEPLTPVRAIEDPTHYGPLARFSCGSGEQPWERHVDRVALRLARGEAIPQTLLAVEDAVGELVGLCSFWLGNLLMPMYREPINDAPYINIIGVDARFQGRRLTDGSRAADALLDGALEWIRNLHGAVHVFALVAPENSRGHALFARHAFGEISPMNAGRQALRVRPPLTA
jgi:hypothetical protein